MVKKITMLVAACVFVMNLSAPSAFADQGAARVNVADPWNECGLSAMISADGQFGVALSPGIPCASYGAQAAPPRPASAMKQKVKTVRAILGEPRRAFAIHLNAKNRDPA
jgi:hypothetical protein